MSFNTDFSIQLGFNRNNKLISGVSTGQWGQEGHAHYFNFQTKQGPTASISNTRDVAFYECSEITQTRNFTIFNAYTTTFGQFTVDFIFSNNIGEIDHFTLDLLKSFLL